MNKNMPYNVMRHTNWEFAPRDPVSIGTAIITGLGGSAAAAATTIAFGVTVAGVVGYVAVSLVTSWALSALAPKQKGLAGGDLTSQGLLVNNKSAIAPHDFVYGEVRKGGTITYYETTGTENKFLHQIIALAGHEVDAISDIYLNDEVVTLDSNGFVTSSPWNSKIRIKKHLGTASQTADSDLLAESAQITSNFRGQGIAYLYVRYEYDQEVFANGLPLVTAVVRGKKLFDPRTSNTAYSNNAALCVRDYIAADYGLNDTEFDNTVFSAAANISDESVALDGGGTEKRYTINGVIRASQDHGDVLQNMMTACAGSLFWGAGKWKLVVGDYVAPTKNLTLDDLRGPISLATRVNLRDQFNGVQGTFNDASNRWLTTDYPPIKSSTFESEDGGQETLLDLVLNMTTSSATAQRLAKLTLFRGREQMTLTADFGLNAFDVEVGEIITLTNPRYGWNQKEFEVAGWNFGAGESGSLRVSLTLRETSEAAFDWNAEETAITQNNTNLPDQFAGLNILNLSVSSGGRTQSDGTFVNAAIFDWDAASSAFVSFYEVEWKPVSDSTYNSTVTSETSVEISPVVDGVEYSFRVRAVTNLGIRGQYSSIQATPSGDTSAPSLPTTISAVGEFRYIVLSWTRPANVDFNYVEVYENDSNTTAGATLVGRSSGDNFVRGNLPPGTTKWYFLKSVDFSGNQSGFTSGVSATTAYLDDEDFANGIYSLFTDQGLYAIRDVTSLPVSGTFVGEKVYNRTDGKLYQWTGSAWVLVIADVADDSITETKIADNSISTPKLQANAVTANEIAASTITGDKIVANTITGGLLATSGIITNTAQINDLIVDSAKIKDLAVERIKIGENAVSEVNTASVGSFNYTASQLNANTIIVSLPSPTLQNITTELYFSFLFDAITNPAPHFGYLPINGWIEVRLQIDASFSLTFPSSFFNIGPVFSGQATKPNINTVNKVLLSGSIFLTPTETKSNTVFRAKVSTAVYDSSGNLLGTSGRVDGLMFTRLLAK